jgi:hypothetical protein
MKTYIAKSLVDGYKLGKEFAGKVFVAVPKQKATKGNIVKFQDKLMRIDKEPILEIQFKDKFGRGTYILCYYEWKPHNQIQYSLW